MERIRYVFALWCVALFPPAVLFWLAFHPFVAFWRRRGAAFTYTVLVSGMLALAALLVWRRDGLMAVDFGFRPTLAALGLGMLIAGAAIDRKAKDHLRFRTLAGVPELQGRAGPDDLLTEGIYGRIRHPRYTGVVVSLAGVALVTNYLSVYLVLALTILGLWAVTVLEERELVSRFGEAYRAYQRAVPRFVPRRRT